MNNLNRIFLSMYQTGCIKSYVKQIKEQGGIPKQLLSLFSHEMGIREPTLTHKNSWNFFAIRSGCKRWRNFNRAKEKIEYEYKSILIATGFLLPDSLESRSSDIVRTTQKNSIYKNVEPSQLPFPLRYFYSAIKVQKNVQWQMMQLPLHTVSMQMRFRLVIGSKFHQKVPKQTNSRAQKSKGLAFRVSSSTSIGMSRLSRAFVQFKKSFNAISVTAKAQISEHNQTDYDYSISIDIMTAGIPEFYCFKVTLTLFRFGHAFYRWIHL